jgi:hypothetical protein
VTEAIFGLLGVVVGGLLSGGMMLGIEHVREHRDARTAARLVHYELIRAVSLLEVALDLGSPLPFVVSFATEAWSEHRSGLARTLDTSTWGAALSAYSALEAVDQTFTGPDFEPRGGLTEEGFMYVGAAAARVREALDALGRVGSVPSDDHIKLVKQMVAERVASLPEE